MKNALAYFLFANFLHMAVQCGTADIQEKIFQSQGLSKALALRNANHQVPAGVGI